MVSAPILEKLPRIVPGNSTEKVPTIQHLPIIIFCDPKFEEFKDQKIIINLKKNQILFDNPHKAIKRLIDLDKDISLWWKDKNLQKFIKEYTDEFAKLNKNYDKDFCNYLEKN